MVNYIVPIDFSDHSKSAAAYAASLSKVWPGNLHLVHVIVPIVEEPEYLPVKTLNVKRNTVFELVNFQEVLRNKFSARSNTDIVSGDIPSQIRKLATEKKADIIVMGNQGISGLRQYLFGSNATSLMQDSATPVMLVSESHSFKPFQKLTYFSDYNSADTRHLVTLANIARHFNATLDVVSVNSTLSAEERASFVNLVSTITSYHNIVSTDLLHENESNGILGHVQRDKFDLLALSNRHQEILLDISGRGLVEEFQFHADVPLLVFPD